MLVLGAADCGLRTVRVLVVSAICDGDYGNKLRRSPSRYLGVASRPLLLFRRLVPLAAKFSTIMMILMPRTRGSFLPGMTGSAPRCRWRHLAVVPTSSAVTVKPESVRNQLHAVLHSIPTEVSRALDRVFGRSSDSNDGTKASSLAEAPRDTSGVRNLSGEVASVASNVLLYAVDALTPWDFDRHDFGVTFAHTWEEHDLIPGGLGAMGMKTKGSSTKGIGTSVKVTSTVKPGEREWKVSARTRLWQSDDGAGVVFAKGGMFLAGSAAPYIGVEADRVWRLPTRVGLPRTKMFGNVNYRSSRMPRRDPVRWSFGLQHEFALAEGLEITMRVGLHPFEKRLLFMTPVPNGQYY